MLRRPLTQDLSNCLVFREHCELKWGLVFLLISGLGVSPCYQKNTNACKLLLVLILQLRLRQLREYPLLDRICITAQSDHVEGGVAIAIAGVHIAPSGY